MAGEGWYLTGQEAMPSKIFKAAYTEQLTSKDRRETARGVSNCKAYLQGIFLPLSLIVTRFSDNLVTCEASLVLCKTRQAGWLESYLSSNVFKTHLQLTEHHATSRY